MSAPDETTVPPDEKHSVNLGTIILFAVVILLVYVLSVGPVVMLVDKKVIAPTSKLKMFYQPLERLYGQAPFHKPLGLYLHLWSARFDGKGDENQHLR